MAIEWAASSRELLACTVVAPDRTGLLATVAGALALFGFDIEAAAAYSHPDGVALEVFTGVDRFDRLAPRLIAPGVRSCSATRSTGATRARRASSRSAPERYRRARDRPGTRGVECVVDLEASAFATVVEVHAPDDVGLLARVAAVFADLELDVSQAIVSTVGDRVVDVFYLRDAVRASDSPTGETIERPGHARRPR